MLRSSSTLGVFHYCLSLQGPNYGKTKPEASGIVSRGFTNTPCVRNQLACHSTERRTVGASSCVGLLLDYR